MSQGQIQMTLEWLSSDRDFRQIPCQKLDPHPSKSGDNFGGSANFALF